MRSVFAFLIMCSIVVPSAKAGIYKVSTAEFLEGKAFFRLLQEVYKQIGHDLKLVTRPAKRSLIEVNSGISDAELARVTGAEAEYPNLVRVKEPVYALSFSAIVKRSSKLWLSSWKEIEKHRIGYPRGYRILDIRTSKMNKLVGKDPATIARMVKAGRFEVGLLITSDAHRQSTKIPEIMVLKPPVEVVTLYHHLHVKHRRLIPAIEKVLIEFNDSGRSRKIMNGEN